MRDHLRTLARRGHRPPELDTGTPPPELDPIRGAFYAVRAACTGSEPVGWPDLVAWGQTVGVQLCGWEADAVMSLDRAYRRGVHNA